MKFRILLIFLLIGFVSVSCGNSNEEDQLNPDEELHSQQDNKPVVTDPNKQRVDKAPIASRNTDATSPDSESNSSQALILDCNYFFENPNTILKDNPEAAVDYIITCMTTINGKLIIEPGVVIAFEQNTGMKFTNESSFKMEGTAEKPIILTGTENTKGFWSGIMTESTNNNNIMAYVTIDYAGGESISRGLKAALGIYGSYPLTLDHCTFSNSKSSGMEIQRSVGKNEQNIFMTNCTFTKNDIPIKVDATRLRIFNGSNRFSGNDKDFIYLEGGTLSGDANWVKLDVPYFLQNNFKNSEGVLTVESGTEIIMSSQVEMHVSDGASLVMVGTAEDPIIIRGEHDVAGFWGQLTIDSSSPLNHIAHVNFKNAGRTTVKPNGTIWVKHSKFLKIQDVVFSNCFEYGLSLQYSSSKFHLEHANLTLDNTPKLFSDWKGIEVSDPEKT